MTVTALGETVTQPGFSGASSLGVALTPEPGPTARAQLCLSALPVGTEHKVLALTFLSQN